ncbi:MAG: hypothetical protein HFJ49_04405 [Clostridia bacterium]|jgi:hypothetical protein|nr:hypothetical protein [Clostridia bacterium]
MSLTKLEKNLNIIQSLPNKPALEAEDLKKEFDKAGNEIKDYINNVLTKEIEELVNKSKIEIDNTLASTSIDKALSANQGRILKEELDKKQKSISTGTDTPTGGENGDIYIQYFD